MAHKREHAGSRLLGPDERKGTRSTVVVTFLKIAFNAAEPIGDYATHNTGLLRARPKAPPKELRHDAAWRLHSRFRGKGVGRPGGAAVQPAAFRPGLRQLARAARRRHPRTGREADSDSSSLRRAGRDR